VVATAAAADVELGVGPTVQLEVAAVAILRAEANERLFSYGLKIFEDE
jgi:hypothetical protein